MNTKTATIGSISSGTLRTEDLLSAFASELKRLAGTTANPAQIEVIALAATIDPESEQAGELVTELSDELQDFAPAYSYFGAHPGDGADFGFWPCIEEIEELPCIDDPGEAEAFGEDCRFVNDHGNVTVYAADGSVIFDLV